MKSTNEELQSTNEELQSTNEELETSKEELQSINEELVTVNSELQIKLDELSQINNDMNNLLAGTDVGTLFVDKYLRIKRFTPNVTKIINLINSDIGRHVGDIAPKLIYEDLAKDAAEVLRTLVRQERELETRSGGWCLMRIMPYRTNENLIDGIVVTFTDVSEMKKQKLATKAMLDLAINLADHMPQLMLIVNAAGRAVFANTAFKKTLALSDEEVNGRFVYNLRGGKWNIAALEAFIETGKDRDSETFAVELNFPEGVTRSLSAHARRIKLGAVQPADEQEYISIVLNDDAMK